MPGGLLRRKSILEFGEEIRGRIQFLTSNCVSSKGLETHHLDTFIFNVFNLIRIAPSIQVKEPFPFIVYTYTNTNFEPDEEVISDGYIYEYVGAILNFIMDDAGNGHSVAYVKIDKKWYTADNEKGILIERKHGPPCANSTSYFSHTHFGIKDPRYFYAIKSHSSFPRKNTSDKMHHGMPIPSQGQPVGYSCLSDSLQSILFFANGYRDFFVDTLYIGVFNNLPPINPEAYKLTDIAYSDLTIIKEQLMSVLIINQNQINQYPGLSGFLDILTLMLTRYYFYSKLEIVTQYLSKTTGQYTIIRTNDGCSMRHTTRGSSRKLKSKSKSKLKSRSRTSRNR